MATTTGNKGSEFVEKAKDTMNTGKEAAKEAASSVSGAAKDLASAAGHKAGDAAAYAADKADSGVASVGSGMKSLAGTIRENAPHSGVAGAAASSVAGTLESGGRYLQEEGLRGIAEDMTDLIRRNPIPALFVGIGIGFLLARSMRS